MSPTTEADVQRHELESLKADWKWFLLLGILLILLGAIAVSGACAFSVAVVVMFGVLLLIGGIAQVISSFWAGKWSGFLLHLLVGILYIVTGLFIVDAPEESTLTLTLLIAAMLVVSGIFRIVAAMTLRFPDWGWQLLNGVVAMVLGVMIYRAWPLSGLWVIGLFVGVEMMLNGFSWVMMGLGLRRLCEEAEASG